MRFFATTFLGFGLGFAFAVVFVAAGFLAAGFFLVAGFLAAAVFLAGVFLSAVAAANERHGVPVRNVRRVSRVDNTVTLGLVVTT